MSVSGPSDNREKESGAGDKRTFREEELDLPSGARRRIAAVRRILRVVRPEKSPDAVRRGARGGREARKKRRVG